MIRASIWRRYVPGGEDLSFVFLWQTFTGFDLKNLQRHIDPIDRNIVAVRRKQDGSLLVGLEVGCNIYIQYI